MQTIRSTAAFKPATGRRALVVSNSAVAPAVVVPYKGTDGADKGTKQVALKVAEESAKGLVHRYMVMVQQNARRVSVQGAQQELPMHLLVLRFTAALSACVVRQWGEGSLCC